LIWMERKIGRHEQETPDASSSAWGAARWGALVVGCALASFWYLRNYLELGNPLGLLQIRAFGHVIFPGELSHTNLARTNLFAVFRPFSVHDWSLAFANAREWLGIPMLALFLGAVAALVRGRRDDRQFKAKLLLPSAETTGPMLGSTACGRVRPCGLPCRSWPWPRFSGRLAGG